MPAAVTDPPTFSHFELPESNLRLGINANHKLKTVVLKAFFVSDLDEAVTRRALLPMVLRRGTRRFTDMQALNRHLDKLYGAVLSAGVLKVGEWHVVKFHLEVVNDRFLPQREGLFDQGLELLREVIFEPLEVVGAFRADFVEQEKANLKRTIEALLDDKSSYSAFRCIEEMCRSEPFRLSEDGRIQDLSGIGPTELRAFYEDWRRSAPLWLYATGDLDIEATRHRISATFGAPRETAAPLSGLPRRVAVKEPREVRETMEVQQARLVLGYRHGVTYCDDDYEALLLMNGILGGFSHSKLFQNVREKASLAYSAHSWLERTKGLLFIGCGIAAENFERSLDIILEQVDAMKRGDIDSRMVEATLKTLVNHNLMLEDSLSRLADVDFVWGLHGRRLDLVRFRERLARVSLDDIVRVARRLEHDTTYFLHR